jgi:hypothetical protein
MTGQLALFDGVQLAIWTTAQLRAVPLACPHVPGGGEQRGITARIGRNSLSVYCAGSPVRDV